MIKVKVLSVDQGPQEEAEFTAHGSAMYPMAWMCTVLYENGAQEQAKVTVNGRSRSGGYCKKFVEAGKYLCAEERGMYKEIPQIKVEAKSTKLANGEEAWKPSDGGGDSSGSHQAPVTPSAGPVIQMGKGYTREELVALLASCDEDVHDIVDGDTSSDAMQTTIIALFNACVQEGVKDTAVVVAVINDGAPTPPPTTGMPPPPGKTVNNPAMQKVLDTTPPPVVSATDESLPF